MAPKFRLNALLSSETFRSFACALPACKHSEAFCDGGPWICSKNIALKSTDVHTLKNYETVGER